MFNHTHTDVREMLGTVDPLISVLREKLIVGVDWIRDRGGYKYSETGLEKLRNHLVERDVKVLDFVKQVESVTEMKEIDGTTTQIHLAMIEYLKENGYRNYEIAKRLPYTEDSIQVMKSRIVVDWKYKTIKEQIYKIGESCNAKKS